jgi:NAD+ synthase (glutamine-hydrolysing)
MVDKLRVGLVQMRSEKGNLAGNMAEMIRHINEADRKGIDILGFPEATLTEFINPAKYPEAVIRAEGPEMRSLAAAIEGRNPVVLAGFIEHNSAGPPFITQAVIRDGALVGYHRKNAGVFEDEPWFASGDNARAFHHEDITFGISICAEIMEEDTFAGCSRQEANIVFELAASGLYGKQEGRNWESGFRWWEGVCLEKLGEYSRKYGI